MKKIILTISAALLGALTIFAAEVGKSTPKGFIDDFDVAMTNAAKSGRVVVAVFSGSDWCIWCQRLEKEILSDEEFIKDATNRYELVFLDFPQDKTLVRESLVKRNQELAEYYHVGGYPTVLLLDSKGEVLHSTGYRKGGGAKYLKYLNKEVKHAPLVRKFMKPLTDEWMVIMKDLEKDLKVEMGGKMMTKETMRVFVQKKGKDYIARLTALKEKALKTEMPKGVAKRRDKFVEQLTHTISGFVDLGQAPEDKK